MKNPDSVPAANSFDLTVTVNGGDLTDAIVFQPHEFTSIEIANEDVVVESDIDLIISFEN